MITEEVQDEEHELRDLVDDMVLFKEDETDIETVDGLNKDLNNAKQKLTNIAQVLDDIKQLIFMPNNNMEKLWQYFSPEYKGKVGQAVVDLGITHTERTRKPVLTKAKESQIQE
eukprot:5771829-Heterocapsa_arctica.AAC.1